VILSFLLLLHVDANGHAACDQKKADQGIQQEMNICAAEEYRVADKALNVQWKLTYAEMKKRDGVAGENFGEDTHPEWAVSLLMAQRAWIKFRDAHCKTEGNIAFGGSLQPLLVSTCKTVLTEARTQQLKELGREF